MSGERWQQLRELAARPAALPGTRQTWLLLGAAFAIIGLLFILTARHAALESELHALRASAGQAQDLAGAIRAAQAQPVRQPAPEALAAALNDLAARNRLALTSEASGQTVTTRGQDIPATALTEWLTAAQQELRVPVSEARFDLGEAGNAQKIEVRIVWTAGAAK